MSFWSWLQFGSKKPEKKVETEATKNGQEPVIPDVPQIKVSNDYPYIIQLYDIFGDTSKELEPFGAKREIIGGNVYLVNEKVGFKERFPEDTETYKEHKIAELDKKIQSTEDKLKELKSLEATPEQLDLKNDLKLFKNWKRSLELRSKGSYVIIASDKLNSKPKFSFDRKGNFKLPVYKDVDHSTIRVPSEAQITTGSELLRENELKNGTPDNTNRLLTFGVLALLLIALCVMGYFMYKTVNSNTPVAQALINVTNSIERIAESNEIYAKQFKEATDNLNDIIDRVEVTDKPPSVTPAQNTAR